MTYPTNPKDALDAGGAFVIGGGDFNFGQDYTEQIVKSLFKVPEFNIGNALDVMREQLLKLPMEALEAFKPIIPDWIEDDFANVANAVTKIMSILTAPIKFLLEADWQAWINSTWSEFQRMVNQIIEILQGHVITPINQAVQGVKDWWNQITTGVADTAHDIQDTWNSWWGALTGRTPDENQTAAEPAERIGELAGTTSANSSAIAELQRRLDDQNQTGVAGGDDFERVNQTNVGPGWAEFYSNGSSGKGFYSIPDGHECRWTDQGAQQNTATFVRTDPADEKTLTDFQKMTLVVGTISGEVAGPFQGGSHIRLWVRVNDNAPTVGITDGVYIEIGGASLAQFGYRRNGTDTYVGSSFSCSWGAGSIFSLNAGTVDGIGKFEFYKNGSKLGSWSDDAAATARGANNRRWGWEGQARNRNLGQGTPCSVTRVTITDNDPAGVGAAAIPYDINYVHSVGKRAVGVGDNPFGVKLQRSVTFSSLTFRCATADPAGANTLVELRKNGTAVATAILPAAAQLSGATATGSWTFAQGDILTVYISSVPSSNPGSGLVLDAMGVVL
ncbi:hypothetical protein ODIN_30 [Mycobacterium phage Odin]|nr:hypothetical protein ODIN_30 [Mycobacterium phage Odin]